MSDEVMTMDRYGFKAKKPQIVVFKRNLRFLLSLRRDRDSTQS
jgi:hypothetical protein